MSSQNSRQVPTFAEHRDAVAAAVVEVSENSFFAFVAPAEPDLFSELVNIPSASEGDASGEGRWLRTSVSFDGAFNGVVEVAMPERLARELLASFVGLGPDDPVEQEELVDSTGEFVNQVCGTWLTRACHHRRFDLTPPAVERMPVGWAPVVDEGSAGERGWVYFTLNDQPVSVGVRFAPFGESAT